MAMATKAASSLFLKRSSAHGGAGRQRGKGLAPNPDAVFASGIIWMENRKTGGKQEGTTTPMSPDCRH